MKPVYDDGRYIIHIANAICMEEIEQIVDFVKKTGHLPDGSDPTEGDIEVILDQSGNLKLNGAEIVLDKKENMEVKTKDGKTHPFHMDAEDMVFYYN